MNKQTIRARFNHYRQQIAELKIRISELTSELEQSYYRREESISRIERRARAAENERIERERQAESDRWYRDDQLRNATRDLERAVSYGDDYGIKRATEKIKRLEV